MSWDVSCAKAIGDRRRGQRAVVGVGVIFVGCWTIAAQPCKSHGEVLALSLWTKKALGVHLCTALDVDITEP